MRKDMITTDSIDDPTFRQVIDAFESESLIEILGMNWRVIEISYTIRDGIVKWQFDLDVVDAPYDRVSHNLVADSISGGMCLRCETLVPGKWME
jgi:hypothetical protein